MTEQQSTEAQGAEEQGQQPASQDHAENQQFRMDYPRQPEPQAPAQAQSTEDMVPESVLRERERDNKKLRDRLRQLEKAQQERADKEKSQLERLSEEGEALRSMNADLQNKLRRFYFNELINIPNARWAWAAAQDAGIEIEFDDEHRPTNLKDVRKRLKELDPTLFGAGKVDAGETGRAPVQEQTEAGFLGDLLFGRNR